MRVVEGQESHKWRRHRWTERLDNILRGSPHSLTLVFIRRIRSEGVQFTSRPWREKANVAAGPNHYAAPRSEQSLLLRIDLAGDFDQAFEDRHARFAGQCYIHAELGAAHGDRSHRRVDSIGIGPFSGVINLDEIGR